MSVSDTDPHNYPPPPIPSFHVFKGSSGVDLNRWYHLAQGKPENGVNIYHEQHHGDKRFTNKGLMDFKESRDAQKRFGAQLKIWDDRKNGYFLDRKQGLIYKDIHGVAHKAQGVDQFNDL